jgi:creatinine amidohydrolase
MGSDPSLARAEHGATFLELAATALCKDLEQFLSHQNP